jgi:hypothetical protein
MRKKWWIILVAPPAIVLFVWIFGEIVMHLWNWLLPDLFGWRQVNFWQALGLLVLCRILFGGFGHNGRGDHKRRRLRDRWEKATPEERERLREWMHSRGGDIPGPPARPGAPA